MTPTPIEFILLTLLVVEYSVYALGILLLGVCCWAFRRLMK